jgi:hypothetical protein
MRGALLACALGVASCYSPSVKDGLYLCPNNGPCPDNLVCNGCGVCIQASEPLDAQVMCPATASCSATMVCMLTDCMSNDKSGDLSGCIAGCESKASQATQTMYLDPFLSCAMSNCKCPGDACGMCLKAVTSQKGGACILPACGACVDLYNACLNAM